MDSFLIISLWCSRLLLEEFFLITYSKRVVTVWDFLSMITVSMMSWFHSVRYFTVIIIICTMIFKGMKTEGFLVLINTFVIISQNIMTWHRPTWILLETWIFLNNANTIEFNTVNKRMYMVSWPSIFKPLNTLKLVHHCNPCL